MRDRRVKSLHSRADRASRRFGWVGLAAVVIAAVACSDDRQGDGRPTGSIVTSTTEASAATTTTGPASSTTLPATSMPLPPRREPETLLVVADDAVEFVRYDGVPEPSLVGFYVAPIGQSIDFQIQRSDYLTEPTATVARTTDGTTKFADLSESVEFGDGGFSNIGSLDILGSGGEVITGSSVSWCPNDALRIDELGLLRAEHTSGCGWFDYLAFGTRWGVTDGWGSQLSVDNVGALDLPDGTYQARLSIQPELARSIGAPTKPATFELVFRPATVDEIAERAVDEFADEEFEEAAPWFDAEGSPLSPDPDTEPRTVYDADGNPVIVNGFGQRIQVDEFGEFVDYIDLEGFSGGSESEIPNYVDDAYIPPPGTPLVPDRRPATAPVDLDLIPDGAPLPDLRVYPSYGIRIVTEPEGRDFLAFNATTWNAGPGTLMIEGFRRNGEPGMDAFQILVEDGTQVAALPAGKLDYHRGDGHEHWHLLDFGRYELTDADKKVVRDSGKQEWCLALTDTVDLSPLHAPLNVEYDDLTSACGGPDDLWSRQEIPSGYGDTYTPAQTGQVFDITALPNGEYYIKLTTNPDRVLAEADLTNNTSFRWVILDGEPGARTVRVPPFQGVDTDAFAEEEFFG